MMKERKTINTVILWVVAIGLLVSMVIAFTPTLGLNRGAAGAATVVKVNNDTIDELELTRLQQSPPFNLVRSGSVGEELESLLIDQAIDQTLLSQAAARNVRVSGSEVRTAVQTFREENGVAGRNNDSEYLNLIRRLGYDDQGFREYMRERERRQKYNDAIIADIKVTDAQVRDYFDLNRDAYLSEPQIVGRYVVVDDQALAEDLRERIVGGEATLAEVAREYSLERSDQGGALAGTDDALEAAGKLALPTRVADVAFALTDGGITEVVESSGMYYIVQVSSYLAPEQRPFDEVEAAVRERVQQLAELAAVEQRLEQLREEATIEMVDNDSFRYSNPVLAKVGEVTINQNDLSEALYGNPSIQNFLGPQANNLIGFFKPQVLEQLIEQELAYQGAQRLDIDFIGTPSVIAQNALSYVAKDVDVDAQTVQQYYNDNLINYTEPAEADAVQLVFSGRDSAESARLALLDGDITLQALEERIDAYQGEWQDLGTISVAGLPVSMQTPVFGADARGLDTQLEPIAGSDFGISPVQPLSTDESNFTMVIANVTPERVRPFGVVEAEARAAALNVKKAEARQAWLEQLRAEIPVTNLQAQAAQDAQQTSVTPAAGLGDAEPTFTTQPLPEAALAAPYGTREDVEVTEQDSSQTPQESEPVPSQAQPETSATPDSVDSAVPTDAIEAEQTLANPEAAGQGVPSIEEDVSPQDLVVPANMLEDSSPTTPTSDGQAMPAGEQSEGGQQQPDLNEMVTPSPSPSPTQPVASENAAGSQPLSPNSVVPSDAQDGSSPAQQAPRQTPAPSQPDTTPSDDTSSAPALQPTQMPVATPANPDANADPASGRATFDAVSEEAEQQERTP